MLNLNKQTIKEEKEIKVKKNFKKNAGLISTIMFENLRLRQKKKFLFMILLFNISSTPISGTLFYSKILYVTLYVTCTSLRTSLCNFARKLRRLRRFLKEFQNNKYTLKGSNRSTTERCKTCSKLPIKTVESYHCPVNSYLLKFNIRKSVKYVQSY